MKELIPLTVYLTPGPGLYLRDARIAIPLSMGLMSRHCPRQGRGDLRDELQL